MKLAGEGAAEAGAGPGSYDIRKAVWHVNVSQTDNMSSILMLTLSKCCSPLENGDGGWGVFNSLFGWQNTATYGSVISYNLYWLTIIVGFLVLGYKEKTGHWPLQKGPTGTEQVPSERSDSHDREISNKDEGIVASSDVREVRA